MTEGTTEKVFCCDNNPLNSMALGAMMNNGGFGNGNNPWAYIMMMWVMRMWGNEGWNRGVDGMTVGENYNSRAIATLQDTVNQNHLNSTVLDALGNNQAAVRELAQTFHTDINTIQQGVNAINTSIQQVSGQLGYGVESVKNAVALGDNGIIKQICDCCCSTKMAMAEGFNATQRELLNGSFQNQIATERQTGILGSKMDNHHSEDLLQNCQQTNTLERAIENNRQAIVSGFSQIGYQNEKNTSAIIQNNTAQTQRILDMMCQTNTQALRDLVADKDRQLQTQTIIAQLKKECGCGIG